MYFGQTVLTVKTTPNRQQPKICIVCQQRVSSSQLIGAPYSMVYYAMQVVTTVTTTTPARQKTSMTETSTGPPRMTTTLCSVTSMEVVSSCRVLPALSGTKSWRHVTMLKVVLPDASVPTVAPLIPTLTVSEQRHILLRR